MVRILGPLYFFFKFAPPPLYPLLFSSLFFNLDLEKFRNQALVYDPQEARTDILNFCFLPKCILYSPKKFVPTSVSPSSGHSFTRQGPRGQVTKDKAWEVWELFQLQTDMKPVRSLSLAPRFYRE